MMSGSEDSKYKDSYHYLANDRIIFLSEDITNETGSFLSALLIYYDKQNNNDITIYINSEGGDIAAFCNIYDVMQMIQSPINTICIGKAYSAAAILLSAGTHGKRFAMKNSGMMIHGMQVDFPFSENSDQIDSERELKVLEWQNSLLMKILSKHTGNPASKITKDCERDLFLDADEALEYGLIDAII